MGRRGVRVHAMPTHPAPAHGKSTVSALPADGIFIAVIVGLYAVTRWLTWALSRLGGVE